MAIVVVRRDLECFAGAVRGAFFLAADFRNIAKIFCERLQGPVIFFGHTRPLFFTVLLMLTKGFCCIWLVRSRAGLTSTAAILVKWQLNHVVPLTWFSCLTLRRIEDTFDKTWLALLTLKFVCQSFRYTVTLDWLNTFSSLLIRN